MPVYSNLPGTVVIKEDGNLAILEGIPGDITVILGTSPDGPLESLYLVKQTSDAESTFDPSGTKEGTLLRGMYEAFDTGSKYVALYKIGATQAILKLNGWTIHTIGAGLTDADKFKIYYSFSAGAHILKIYDATTGETLFNSLTGVDTGAISATFDADNVNIASGSFSISTDNAGVVLSEAVQTPIVTLTTASFEIGDNFFTLGNEATVKAGNTIAVSTVANNEAVCGKYKILYVKDSKAYVQSKDGVAFTTFAVAHDLLTHVATMKLIPSFTQATNGLTMTENAKYEALERAYWTLEAAKVSSIVPMGAYMNTANLVNNVGVSVVPVSGDFLGKAYKFELNGEIFFFWQTNTDTKAELLPTPEALGIDGLAASKLVTGNYSIDSILSQATSPATDITFSEVNYAHQAATYCHNLSTNMTECFATIGVVAPVNFSKTTITNWVGKLPAYSTSTGLMTVSGTGLLGNKCMVGSAGTPESGARTAPGFFATADGTYGDTPEINPLTKKTDDIGRYLNIVCQPLIKTGTFSTTASGYLATAAADYCGMIMKLDANKSPQDKVLSTIHSLPFSMHLNTLNKLVGCNYVVFNTDDNGNVYVMNAPTAALSTSDYTGLMTNRVVGTAVVVARQIAKPFFGNLFGGEQRNALEDQENEAMHKLKNLGYLTAGLVKVRATRDQEIKGEAIMRLELVIPGTLKKIILYVALSK